MAAVLTRGYSFGSTEQVTNTKLHTLVDSATIASVDRTNFDSVTRPVTATASDLSSPVAGELQARTDQFGLQLSDATNWYDVPLMRRQNNQSGLSLTKGDVVVAGTNTASCFITVQGTAAATHRGEVMVLLEAAAGGSVATVRGIGYATVNLLGSATIGQYLGLSTASQGKAVGQAGFVGAFGRVLQGGTNSCIGLLFGNTMDGVQSGMIVMSTGACPSGYTRLTALDNRFPMGASTYGSTGGSQPAFIEETGPGPIVVGSTALMAYDGTVVRMGTQGTGGFNPVKFNQFSTSVPDFVGVVFCKKD